MELTLHNDVKVADRNVRMRVTQMSSLRVGDRERSFAILVRPVNRRFKNCGPTRQIGPGDIQALCTGRDDDGSPIWTPVTGWYEIPSEHGKLYLRLDHGTTREE